MSDYRRPLPNECDGYYSDLCCRGPVNHDGLCPQCAAWVRHEVQAEKDYRKAGW